MFRRLTAAALLALVQIGAIAAPLTHVHLGEETAHDHGQSLHAHLSGHRHAPIPSASGAVFDHQDDTGLVVSARIFVSAASEPFSLPAVAPQPFSLLVLPAQPHGRTPHVAHAHDPPSIAVRSPRPPPVSLS